jgi:hypothetical protein
MTEQEADLDRAMKAYLSGQTKAGWTCGEFLDGLMSLGYVMPLAI